MKNVMMKLKSVLAIGAAVVVLCAFSSGDVWYDWGEFKSSLIAENAGHKEFIFSADDEVHVYIKNHSAIPVLIYVKCVNTQEVIEQVLLPQESTMARPFMLNDEPILPVEWVFLMDAVSYDTSNWRQILVEFIAGWNGFYGYPM